VSFNGCGRRPNKFAPASVATHHEASTALSAMVLRHPELDLAGLEDDLSAGKPYDDALVVAKKLEPITSKVARGLTFEAVRNVQRAERELVNADLVLWLGPPRDECSASVWQIQSFADLGVRQGEVRHAISSVTGEGIDDLLEDLVAHARLALPKPGSVALNKRQHELIAQAEAGLAAASRQRDPLLAAEELRRARVAMDRLLGRAATEDMLDALFGRFCIGK